MINVILADHERIFRIGMASALAAEDDIRIVGQPHTPDQLMHGLENFKPHVVVLSSAFRTCIDAINQKRVRNQTAMLLLEDYGEMAPPQLPMDFQGMMPRSADEATVVHCIRHLARGGTVLRLTHSGLQEPTRDTVALRLRQRLTPHELGIIAGVVQGYKNREIAVRMRTTEQSVKYSLRKIFDKTGVFGRLELALFVLHHRTLMGTVVDSRPVSDFSSAVASLRSYRETPRRPTIN
jgi:DNA-binding NarL/FixJ family response regulator